MGHTVVSRRLGVVHSGFKTLGVGHTVVSRRLGVVHSGFKTLGVGHTVVSRRLGVVHIGFKTLGVGHTVVSRRLGLVHRGVWHSTVVSVFICFFTKMPLTSPLPPSPSSLHVTGIRPIYHTIHIS